MMFQISEVTFNLVELLRSRLTRIPPGEPSTQNLSATKDVFVALPSIFPTKTTSSDDTPRIGGRIAARIRSSCLESALPPALSSSSLSPESTPLPPGSSVNSPHFAASPATDSSNMLAGVSLDRDPEEDIVPGCRARPVSAPTCPPLVRLATSFSPRSVDFLTSSGEGGSSVNGTVSDTQVIIKQSKLVQRQQQQQFCLNDGVCMQLWTELVCDCELTSFSGHRCGEGRCPCF
ncbi:unnamed protein product [Protopolystoma xenopodis]|uniref:EGF-like domain-containing protein n=1 Tax=Protopolystoma xenopodis TaxID=117903 RepID=A0A3S5CJW7_9PLAT|nr:unnamed protein product [Protopolystoma xenopodis]